MSDFQQKDYKIFDLFSRQWGVVTAGSPEHFNSCTIAWGSLGTLWNKSVAVVYLHPTRYTCELMKENETFSICFFPEEQKKALGILGRLSGRDTDKTAASGLTPAAVGDTVGYEEASLTFVCRKLYQHLMTKEDLAADIQAYYASSPRSFPPDENGEWHPHWVFIGEITDVIDKR